MHYVVSRSSLSYEVLGIHSELKLDTRDTQCMITEFDVYTHLFIT